MSAAAPESAVPVAGPARAPAELTLRALAIGCAIGVMLAATNIYMGLKTGWWDTGAITASILAAVFLGAVPRRGGAAPGALETNIAQTTATSIGAIPAVAGLLGALPALGLMHVAISGAGIAAWGLGLGVLGVLVALLLRKRLLVDENLPFPSGIATAELITAIHDGRETARERARVLLGTGVVAMDFTWLRDGQRWIAQATFLPGSIGGVPAAALTLGMNWSPLMLAVGVLVGIRMGASVLLGSITAWVVAGPLLVQHGAIAKAEYGPLIGWLSWPGVALMVGASAVTLVQQARTLPAALRDMRSLRKSPAAGAASLAKPLLASTALCVVLVVGTGHFVFGLGVAACLAILGLSIVLGLVCARAAGQTDFSPAGTMGLLTQGVFGASTTSSAALNVAAGSIVAGSSAETATLLWSLRTGQILGASVRSQTIAQLIGVVVGAAISVPIYFVVVNAYGLGSTALPAVSAIEWKTVAEVFTGDSRALPPGAVLAALAGLVLGVALTLLENSPLAKTRAGKWIPSPTAMGVGFIAPFGLGLAIFTGAALCAIAERLRPAKTQFLAPAIAAGAIAGESLMGVVIAILIAAGVLSAPS